MCPGRRRNGTLGSDRSVGSVGIVRTVIRGIKAAADSGGCPVKGSGRGVGYARGLQGYRGPGQKGTPTGCYGSPTF